MDNKITPFSFNGTQVRVITRDGAPWWVAADVARALGLPRATDMTKYIDADERGVITNHPPQWG